MTKKNIKIDDSESELATPPLITPPMDATMCEILPPLLCLTSLRHCPEYYWNLVALAPSPKADSPTTYDIPSCSYKKASFSPSSSDINDSGSDADLDSDTGTEIAKPRRGFFSC